MFVANVRKLANHYLNVLKTAQDQDLNKVTDIVKSVVDRLKDAPGCEGVLYASTVDLQHLPESFHVSFVLNTDKKKEGVLAATKPQRDNLIKTEAKKSLESFLNFPVTIDFGEVLTDDPGWFGKKFD